MSWDSYLVTLKGSDPSPILEAAIWGRSAGEESMWCSTPGLTGITAEEIKALVGGSAALQACGPKIAGIKYMLVRDDSQSPESYSMIFSRRVNGVENSVCVGWSSKALVIAVGKPEVKGAKLISNVYNVVDHLRKANF